MSPTRRDFVRLCTGAAAGVVLTGVLPLQAAVPEGEAPEPFGVRVPLPADPAAQAGIGLEAELCVRDGRIAEARLIGGYRDEEDPLRGRSPEDVPRLAARLCAACGPAHALASSLALEKAAGIAAPAPARVIRHCAAQFEMLQAHLLQFRRLVLHGPDDGLPLIPGDAASRAGRKRSLEATAGEALEMRTLCREAAALLGGALPYPDNLVVGGVRSLPRPDRLHEAAAVATRIRTFLLETCLPLVHGAARRAGKQAATPIGGKNLLCAGAFPADDNGRRPLFAPGVFMEGRDLPFDDTLIRAELKYARFSFPEGNTASCRASGHPDPDKEGAYSRIRAASYAGKPMETGPTARLWINNIPLSETGRRLLRRTLKKDVSRFRDLGEFAFSVAGRHIARAEEALFAAEALEKRLREPLPEGTARNESGSTISGEGLAFTETPHGSLIHYMRVEAGRIADHVVVSPSMWNCAPRNNTDLPGPLEAALTGLALPDPADPVAVRRVVRAFAPCFDCAGL